jgi:1-deoxy-D-xylulose-5-phosphate synthase
LPNVQEEPVSARGARLAIWATGDWLAKARDVADRLSKAEHPVVCEVVHARYIKPFDAELLSRQRAAGMAVASIENAAAAGGLGEAIGADFRFGWPDEFVPHGSPAELELRHGLDAESVAAKLAEAMARRDAGRETQANQANQTIIQSNNQTI